jgi:hypothetical protein
MPILHEYKYKKGYYINAKSFNRNKVTKYYVTDQGLQRLRSEGILIGEGQYIPPDLFQELLDANEAYRWQTIKSLNAELFP